MHNSCKSETPLIAIPNSSKAAQVVAEEEESNRKALCVGITEGGLASLLQRASHLTRNEEPINTNIDSLKVRIWINDGADVELDIGNELILLSTQLKFQIFSTADDSSAAASGEVQVSGKLRVILAQGAASHLEFELVSLGLLSSSDSDISSEILKWELLKDHFGGEGNFFVWFHELMEMYATLQNNRAQLIFKAVSLPHFWDMSNGFQVSFLKFRFEEDSTTQTKFFFAVFAIQSLKFPPPCICDPSSGFTVGLERLPEFFLAFGERGIREILTPYTNTFQEAHVGTGGAFYVSAQAWVNTSLLDANIDSSTLRAEMTASGTGRSKAALKVLIGDLARISVSLGVTLRDASVTWSGVESITGTNDEVELLILAPEADPGEIEIEIKTPAGELGNRLLSWLTTNGVNLFKGKIQEKLNKQLKAKVMSAGPGDVTFKLVQTNFHENQALVISGVFDYRN